MKKTAFTLMEVLIALTIVGVLAAMTIPKFFGNASMKANSTLLKSTYSQINDAIAHVMTDQGVRNLAELDLPGDSNSEKLSYFVNKYFSIAKDCGVNSSSCFGNSYRTYEGHNSNSQFSYNGRGMMYYVKLSNGASVAISIDFSGENSEYNIVMIDANGNSAPNAIGKDLFAAKINDDGSLASANMDSGSIEANKLSCKSDGAVAAISCLSILQAKDWNLEHYLD